MLLTEREKLATLIAETAEKYGRKRSSLMPVLRKVQGVYGYVSEEAMQEIADYLGIMPIEVMSVVTFYHFFSLKPKGKYVIRLCQTISCDLAGKAKTARQFENELGIKFGETTTDGKFTLEYTNCLGMCDQGPAVLINDKIYTKVTPEKAHTIVAELKAKVDELTHELEEIDRRLMKEGPIMQGATAPHAGLKKAMEISRSDIVAEIRESGLRGRGGAGFPTAMKWQIAGAAQGERKFVVCNADEGEPGTFKDRMLLLDNTDLLFDGMIIAGHAIGAQMGYIYLRGEYAYLIKHIEATIEKYRKEGLLGANAAGKHGFNFDIELIMGAGAYVCGEETALIESLEGRRGEPRNRPPFPVIAGFDGAPTIVNNVETFVDAALILDRGGAWFKQHGSEKSTGTKLYSVSGDVKKPGIYELPFGITVNQLLAEVGGEDAKAVQIGGASGACVPRWDFNRVIGYEDIATGGSIMVFGKDRDMLHIAENFLEFFVEESCGQCVPCRKGCTVLLEGVHALKAGKCSIAYLKELRELGKTMQLSSKCGLGQAAPNAFLAIVENFKDELFAR